MDLYMLRVMTPKVWYEPNKTKGSVSAIRYAKQEESSYFNDMRYKSSIVIHQFRIEMITLGMKSLSKEERRTATGSWLTSERNNENRRQITRMKKVDLVTSIKID